MFNPFKNRLVFDQNAVGITGGSVAPSILAVYEKTPVNAVAASGVVTFTGTPVAGELLTIGAQSFVFAAARTGIGSFEITINANNTTQAANAKAAINADVVNVTSDNVDGVLTVTAAVKGTSGNVIVLSTNATGTAVSSVSDGKLDGGVNGTVGVANETCCDGSYLYHAIAVNDVTGTNWRRVTLGAVY
jgi:phage tail sheath gpL-like